MTIDRSDPEANALMEAILHRPDDEGPRLVLADWLDERNDPRGEFIRVQCALAALERGDPRRAVLQERERELLDRHREEWLAPMKRYASGFVFRRGFVEEITVEARRFLEQAEALYALTPIRHVKLLDIAGYLHTLANSPLLSKLRALTVYASHIGDSVARILAGSPYLGELRELYLGRNRIGDAGAEALAVSDALTHLTTLDLSSNSIGETGAQALALSGTLTNLRHFNLAENNIGPSGAEALINSSRLNNLTRLNLQQNQLGGLRMQFLIHAKYLIRLRVLNLDANNLHLIGATALAGSPYVTRLEELTLNSNEIGDGGARLLALSPHLCNLRVLSLADNRLGADPRLRDLGIRSLANSPFLSGLQRLDLSQNTIGEAGLQALIASPFLRKLDPEGLRLPLIWWSPRQWDQLLARFGERIRRA
jgi:uncharacterized protein (TIGR02996 family)